MGCAILMGLASCDKDADNIALETVTGNYVGNVYVSLYTPDASIESDNNRWDAGDTLLYFPLCTHIHKNTNMGINFQGTQSVSLDFDSLQNLTFAIRYLNYGWTEEYNPHYTAKHKRYQVEIRTEYSNGLLAHLINPIMNAYVLPDKYENGDSVITSEDVAKLLELADTLSDTISLSNIKTSQMYIKEEGAGYVTYNTEQNSYYHQFTTETINYTRRSNINVLVQYVESKLLPKFAAFSDGAAQSLTEAIDNIKFYMPQSGTVSDGWGWGTFAYSNYRPDMDMHIERATGLLDGLSLLLYGPNMDYVNNKAVINSTTNRMEPKQDLWLLFDYYGNIGDAYGKDWQKKE